jgi:hypothetical protein
VKSLLPDIAFGHDIGGGQDFEIAPGRGRIGVESPYDRASRQPAPGGFVPIVVSRRW